MIKDMYGCAKVTETYWGCEHYLTNSINYYNKDIKSQKYIYIDIPCFEMFQKLIKEYYPAKLPKENITNEELEKRQKLLKYYSKKIDAFNRNHIKMETFIFYNSKRKYYDFIKIPKKVLKDFYFIKFNSDLTTTAFNHLFYKLRREV